ncbi:MAG: hypothetical protein AAF790_07865 [Planctomycetota bacterium]
MRIPGLRAAVLTAAIAMPAAPTVGEDVATLYTQSGDIAEIFRDTTLQGSGAISQTGYDPCCPCPPTYACPPGPAVMPQPSPADTGVPTPAAPMPGVPAPAAPSAADAPPAPAAPADIAPAPSVDSFASDDDFFPTGPFTGGAGSAAAAPLALAVAPGYIDLAPVGTRIRIRYDDAAGANAPTRAEFLYPTIGNLGGEGPDELGGSISDQEIDIRQISIYTEYAFYERLSAFLEVPIRFVDGLTIDGIDVQQGAGDITAGFRWGLVDEVDRHLTTQLRVWAPTGEASRALGVGHASIDVGFIFDRKISDIVTIFGELNDWQTLDAGTANVTLNGVSDTLISLDGNLLRYGIGAGVELVDLGTRSEPCKFTGIVELVGWTVLDGFTTPLTGTQEAVDAVGDTIINGKYGIRWNGKNQTVYVGYGHNWTSDRWYSDLVRLEWGYNF